MARFPLLRSLALAGLLGACSHVPVETMWTLRSFDPMTTDPAHLRAAIVAPAVYAPKPGGAKMTITHQRKGGADRRVWELVLEEVPLVSETGLGRVRPPVGSLLHAFRIAPADLPRLIAARQEALARAAKEPGAYEGSFAVGIDGCRVGGVALPEQVVVSTWIKTAGTDGYVPLLRDVDLVAEMGRDKLLEASPACPGS